MRQKTQGRRPHPRGDRFHSKAIQDHPKDSVEKASGEHGSCPVLLLQDLCRQHMATKSLFNRAEGPPEPSRVSSVSSQFSDAAQASPSSHSSTPSWCEEPAQANMDISTGHMMLVRMGHGPRGSEFTASGFGLVLGVAGGTQVPLRGGCWELIVWEEAQGIRA